MDNLDKIIKNLSAQIRYEMKIIKSRYNNLCIKMDKVIINNSTIKVEDVQQRQWDARKDLWDVYKEEYNTYNRLIKYIEKFKKDDRII